MKLNHAAALMLLGWYLMGHRYEACANIASGDAAREAAIVFSDVVGYTATNGYCPWTKMGQRKICSRSASDISSPHSRSGFHVNRFKRKNLAADPFFHVERRMWCACTEGIAGLLDGCRGRASTRWLTNGSTTIRPGSGGRSWSRTCRWQLVEPDAARGPGSPPLKL